MRKGPLQNLPAWARFMHRSPHACPAGEGGNWVLHGSGKCRHLRSLPWQPGGFSPPASCSLVTRRRNSYELVGSVSAIFCTMQQLPHLTD